MIRAFLILLGVSIATTIYLVIVGASQYKVEDEQRLEDELQMEYLKNWREKNESK